MRFLRLSLILLTCFILIGCYGVGTRISNPDFIGNSKCKPPCWQGMIPGETTFDEALIILEDQYTSPDGILKFYEIIEHDYSDLDAKYTQVLINRKLGEVNLRFESDELLSSIHFYDVNIPLSDVVHDWGEPDTLFYYFEEGYVLCSLFKEVAAEFCTLQSWDIGEQIIPEEDTSIWSVTFIDRDYVNRYIDQQYFNITYRAWFGFDWPINP